MTSISGETYSMAVVQSVFHNQRGDLTDFEGSFQSLFQSSVRMTSKKNCEATHPAKGWKGRGFLRCILNSISFGSQQRRCCQWSGDNSGGSEKVR